MQVTLSAWQKMLPLVMSMQLRQDKKSHLTAAVCYWEVVMSASDTAAVMLPVLMPVTCRLLWWVWAAWAAWQLRCLHAAGWAGCCCMVSGSNSESSRPCTWRQVMKDSCVMQRGTHAAALQT